MLYSQDKWNAASELQKYIAVSNSCNYQVFEAPLRNAYELFIRPLLGLDMCIALGIIYTKATPSEEMFLKATKVQADNRLLYLAQRANALLAFWYDYDELNTLFNDSGMGRSVGDSLYKYNELSLRKGFKAKGFNALDDMLQHLEYYIEFYPEYKLSENYTQSTVDIVRCASEVNTYFPIEQSRLVFLRLRSHMRIVEDTIIAPRLGDVYADFKNAIGKVPIEEVSIVPSKDTYEMLRKRLVPVLVFYALQRMVLQTGELSDKGLFFKSSAGGMSALEQDRPVDGAQLTQMSVQVQKDGDLYWSYVEQFLSDKFGITPIRANHVPNFDNDNRTILII